MKQVRALGQVFVLWRKASGEPVCMDAFCIHLGASLGGAPDGSGAAAIVRDPLGQEAVECPFHKWNFAADGSVTSMCASFPLLIVLLQSLSPRPVF